MKYAFKYFVGVKYRNTLHFAFITNHGCIKFTYYFMFPIFNLEHYIMNEVINRYINLTMMFFFLFLCLCTP